MAAENHDSTDFTITELRIGGATGASSVQEAKLVVEERDETDQFFDAAVTDRDDNPIRVYYNGVWLVPEADVDAANARAAAAERERDALMQTARDVIAWDDKASGNYKGAWEIVADADKLNALNALLYPVTAQPVDGSAAE